MSDQEYYFYASEAFERSQKLRFEKARGGDIECVKRTLQVISDRLGAEVGEIRHPRRFLKSPLTARQKTALHELLAHRCASRSVQLQNELRTIPIEEKEEPMMRLKEIIQMHEADVTFSERKYEAACGSYAGVRRIKCLRREVAHKLGGVFLAFNHAGFLPHVEDCWRPEEVQEGLFMRRIIDIARSDSHAPVQLVKIMAMSLTASSPGIAGHQAGAAIDFRLKHIRTRDFCELGNSYPEGSIVSSLRFPYITAEQWKTRAIFAETMRMAGFKMLFTEDWHASLGDRGMGSSEKVTMKSAHYGPLHSFDVEQRKVHPYPKDAIDKPFLDDEEIRLLVDIARTRMHDESWLHTQQSVLETFRAVRQKRKSSRIT